jgi:hypothetical protein
MDHDTWLQSDNAFEQFHGLDEFGEDRDRDRREAAMDDLYDRLKDEQMLRRMREEDKNGTIETET